MKAPVDLAEIRRNIRGNAEQIRNLVSIFRQTGSKSLADAHAAFAVKDAAARADRSPLQVFVTVHGGA